MSRADYQHGPRCGCGECRPARCPYHGLTYILGLASCSGKITDLALACHCSFEDEDARIIPIDGEAFEPDGPGLDDPVALLEEVRALRLIVFVANRQLEPIYGPLGGYARISQSPSLVAALHRALEAS